MADFDEDDPLKDLLSDEEEFYKPKLSNAQPSKTNRTPTSSISALHSYPEPMKKRDISSELGLEDDSPLPPANSYGRAAKKSSIMAELFDSPSLKEEQPSTTAAPPKTNIRKLLGLDDEDKPEENSKPSAKLGPVPQQSSSLNASRFSGLEFQSSTPEPSKKSPINNPSITKSSDESFLNIGGYAPSVGNQEPRRARRPHSVERKFPLNDPLDLFHTEPTSPPALSSANAPSVLANASQAPERSTFSLSTENSSTQFALIPPAIENASSSSTGAKSAMVLPNFPSVLPAQSPETFNLFNQRLSELTQELQKLQNLIQAQDKGPSNSGAKESATLEKITSLLDSVLVQVQSLCEGQKTTLEQLNLLPHESRIDAVIKERCSLEKEALLTELHTRRDTESRRDSEEKEKEWRARESQLKQEVEQVRTRAEEAQVKWKEERVVMESRWRELEAKWNVEKMELVGQLQVLAIRNEQNEKVIESLREKERNDPAELKWKERHAQLKAELNQVEEMKKELTLEKERYQNLSDETEYQKARLARLLESTLKGKEHLDNKMSRYRLEANRLKKEDKKLQQKKKILVKAKAVLSEEVLRLRLEMERQPVIITQSSPIQSTKNLKPAEYSLSPYPALQLLKSLALQEERCLQDQNKYLQDLNLL